MKNGQQCAFSCITATGVGGAEYSGLTKREYFAAMMMKRFVDDAWTDYATAAKHSIAAADALLTALDQSAG